MPTVMNRPTEATSTELKSFLRELRFERGSAEQTAAALRALIDAGLDRLPLPGSGATLERWRMLAAVAAFDLALVKLYEGHTDALAILAELDGKHSDKGNAWGVWAAEPPTARLGANDRRSTTASRCMVRKPGARARPSSPTRW